MSNYGSIFDECSPVAVTPAGTTESQPRVSSPTQRGQGITGRSKQVLACVVESHRDKQGNYQGETIYPVTANIQTHPAVARQLRQIEFRPFITTEGESVLSYRKMSYAGGKPNTWTESAQGAVNASIDRWGSISADHYEQRYQFVPMENPPAVPDDFPKLNDLFDELLSRFIIDSMDHPVINKLTSQGPLASGGHSRGTVAGYNSEDDDSAY